MNLEKKICLALVTLTFLMGITAHTTGTLHGASTSNLDSLNAEANKEDSSKINEGSVVDEVIWVVGDEPILKSEVEATRLQSEMEGIKYSGG